MRATTLNNVRVNNGFANQRTTRLRVEFEPEMSSVLPVHIVATRAYLRDLRAAEMKEWEQSGGDYLLSE